MKSNLKFWAGVVLLISSFPIGWGEIVLCGSLAIIEKNAALCVPGFAIYFLSWLMLGLGFLLAGPDGYRYSLQLIKKMWGKIVRRN